MVKDNINFWKTLVRVLLVFFIVSCTTSKDLLRDKTKTKTETTEKVKATRPSDTVEMIVPKIVYKDTTIYKRGKTSTIYLNYDKQGNKKFGSICDSINEVIDRKITQYTKNNIRDKQKETTINDTLILYVFLGLAFLIVIFKLANKFI